MANSQTYTNYGRYSKIQKNKNETTNPIKTRVNLGASKG